MRALIQSAVEQGIFQPATEHPHWAAELESSAISPDAAEGWLYWTDTKSVLQELGLAPKLLGLVGGKGQERNHWLVRVLRDHKLQPYAVEAKPRFPGGSAKYVSPKGHTGVDIRGPVDSSTEPVFIVEGGKKAAAVASLGYGVVAINGCWGWGMKRDEEMKRQRQKALHPHISSLDLKDRAVYVLLDADITTNPDVNLAARSLSNLLRSLGANVAIMQVPHEEESTAGIDDYLAEAEPKARKGLFKYLIKRSLTEVPSMTAEAEAELANSRGNYTNDEGEPISNFTVEVQGETVILNNDSLVQDRTFDLVLHPKTGDPLPITVRSESLRDGRLWASHLVPGRFLVYGAGPSFGNALFTTLMEQQDEYEVDEVYGFIGWKGDRYLLPNMTIGAEGEMEDHLGVRLFEEGESAPWGTKARLLAPVDEDDALRSIRAMLDLVEVIPPQLLLAPFAAVLESSEFHWWLYGLTSRGKTHTAQILQSFWGPEHAEQVQQFANITESAFGTTASKVPGLLFTLDDAVNSLGVDREIERKLNRFIRQAFGQGGGFQKGTRSGTGTRTLGSIRTSLLFTAESLAGAESFRNRLIHVEMPTGGFRNWDHYRVDVDASVRDGTYSKAMYQWVTWVAAQGGPKKVLATARERANVNLNLNSFRANQVTGLLLGILDVWHQWLGASADTEVERIEHAILSAAQDAEKQARRDVGLAARFTDIVGQMLLSKDYQVQSRNLDITEDLPIVSYMFEGGRSLGWADVPKGLLYVHKESLRWILQEARRNGIVLSGVVDNATGKGIIGSALREEYQTEDTKIQVAKKRHACWVLPLNVITGG